MCSFVTSVTEYASVDSQGADISLALTSYKDAEKNKKREIVLVVKAFVLMLLCVFSSLRTVYRGRTVVED